MTEQRQQGQVWDAFLRLFHWLLALTFGVSWLTAELGVEYREYHFWSGYTALGLLVFRLCWGFVGPVYARFAHFLRGPAKSLAYLRARLARATPPELYPGHNPLGALAIVALLLLMTAQAVTGLFADDDILYTGPWRDAVSSATASALTAWHHRLFNVLLALVVLHIAMIGLYRWRFGERLLGAMVHGRKSLAAFGDYAPLNGVPWVKGIVVISLAVGAVWLLLFLAPESSMDDYYY